MPNNNPNNNSDLFCSIFHCYKIARWQSVGMLLCEEHKSRKAVR